MFPYILFLLVTVYLIENRRRYHLSILTVLFSPIVELTEGILLYISVTKGGTTLVFLCKIDKDVLFKDMRGATLAPLGNLKYSPPKMTP